MLDDGFPNDRLSSIRAGMARKRGFHMTYPEGFSAIFQIEKTWLKLEMELLLHMFVRGGSFLKS